MCFVASRHTRKRGRAVWSTSELHPEQVVVLANAPAVGLPAHKGQEPAGEPAVTCCPAM